MLTVTAIITYTYARTLTGVPYIIPKLMHVGIITL